MARTGNFIPVDEVTIEDLVHALNHAEGDFNILRQNLFELMGKVRNLELRVDTIVPLTVTKNITERGNSLLFLAGVLGAGVYLGWKLQGKNVDKAIDEATKKWEAARSAANQARQAAQDTFQEEQAKTEAYVSTSQKGAPENPENPDA